ncbi:MAG: hypothetical protein QGI83_00730 [Candidatus Latescibacteria bacterium]|jgi:tetratricopeptide (TPR) repeat protein|nr:hypothetical protein [Candidatus Latescibacterota bacterium]
MGGLLRRLAVLALVLGGWSCSGLGTAEKEAEREYYVVSRDLEQELADLPEAIERYAALAERHAATEAGKRASQRHRELTEAQVFLSAVETAADDSLEALYTAVCRAAPGYPPALRELGQLYYNNTHLSSVTASALRHRAMADRVMRIWGLQDSLWSGYAFKAIPVEREWRNRLCSQALHVAQMLQEFKRFPEALEVINQGLSYTSDEGTLARARVYAAYYTYQVSRYREGVELAEQALAFEHLGETDRARAFHVIGLCYTYFHQDTKNPSDLEAAIEALNQSVVIDPSQKDPRELLRSLRKARQQQAL